MIQGLGADTDVDNLTTSLLVSGAVAGTGAVTQGAGVATSIAGTYGHLTLNADGSYSYIADQAAADALATGVTANDVFSYTVKDPGGLVSNTTTLTITETGTDDAPVAHADTAATSENAPVAINVLANDTDPDDGAVLSVVSASAPVGQGSASVSGNQVVFDPGTASSLRCNRG